MKTQIVLRVWNEKERRTEEVFFKVTLDTAKIPIGVLLRAFHGSKATAMHGAFKIERVAE